MSDASVLVKQLEAMRDNTQRLSKMAASGSISYAEAGKRVSQYGQSAGRTILSFLKENFPDGIAEDDALELIPPALRVNYKYAVNLATSAQEQVNKKARIKLKALSPDFNEEKAVNMAKHIADTGITDDVVKLVQENARSVVDSTIAVNANAHENAGLSVRVIRKYDGVGVHNGRDACEWCLERQGEWEHVADAQADGAFERHPGCGCEIIYQTTRLQWQSQSRGSNWTNISIEEVRQRRRS